jgi:prepilin peptidase CpaA
MIADVIRLGLFPAMMAFAASSDLLTMTISNRVSLILVGGFFALAAAAGMGAADVLSHLGAAGLILVLAFALFARGWIGGGDAKLAAATVLWLGFDHLLPYLIYASLLGGALSVAGAKGMGAAVARQGRRRALWHRACRSGAGRLPAHAMDDARNLTLAPR